MQRSILIEIDDNMTSNLSSFTDILTDEIPDSQPISLPSSLEMQRRDSAEIRTPRLRPAKGTGQHGEFRSVEEIDTKYRCIFGNPYFNLVQSKVIEDALYSDKSIVVCAPTGSGKTVVFEMAIAQLLMDMENENLNEDFKIIYMAPVKALCTERLTEWYPKFTSLGLLCIEVTGDTDVDFGQLQAYKLIITTPEKWDMLTRRWRDLRGLVEMIKLFLIDEVHILNDEVRGPVLEAVVSRMKTVESSAQSAHRIEKLQKQYQGVSDSASISIRNSPPRIRFVAVSATVSNPEDVAAWLGTEDKPAVFYKFGDECRPVKLKRVVEGYPCSDGTSIFKFDIILNYKLWPIIQKYHNGKPTLIFCNTRKSVVLTAEALSREITITFNPEQRANLTALASTIKTKKLQSLILAGVGCHHAGMLFEERLQIEHAFRNRDMPILITTTTLAMGVNLPAHLVIIKNTQQYVNGAYQEYSMSTVLQMVGRAGRPQFDTEATAVIMTRQRDKARYQALVGGCDPLQSYLHKRLAENLNSEAALGTVSDVAQCVQWLRSTFLYVRAAKDPKRYLSLPPTASSYQISKKIEEICVRAMNSLASSGLITMDEASCIESTEAGRLMSIYYLDLETMKLLMKIEGNESLECLLRMVCECHELADLHLRVDERRCLNALNRNNASATIRFPMKGKINSRQMKLNCIIQAVLGCLPIPDPSLHQEAMKVMRIVNRICKCLVAYVTRPEPLLQKRKYFSAILNSLVLAKCVAAHLWENSHYVSKQLKGIGPAFSTLLATAGKVNFMLLEQSHPRDLERIMNKGPPIGNVLQKQISLLPKYCLVANPLNEKTALIKLMLLNQAFLADNMDNLTAGDSHKSYIIAGDTENHILLLTPFKDRDLISVYDGIITYEITRIHNFEHKIFVHCISSSIVGIDVTCEYTFINLMSSNCTRGIKPNIDPEISKDAYKSSTYYSKERKRKATEEISQSKEKKKREAALIDKIKLLRESFGRVSNKIKEDLQQTDGTSESVIKNNSANDITEFNVNVNDIITASSCNVEKYYDDNFKDSENIDDILNEIESEINGNQKYVNSENACMIPLNLNKTRVTENTVNNNPYPYRPLNDSKRSNIKNKSNFKFMELLDKNIDLSDDENETVMQENENGFSEAIKSQIEKYLQKSRNFTVSKELYDPGEFAVSSANDKSTCSDINNITSNTGTKADHSIDYHHKINDKINSTNSVIFKKVISSLNLDQEMNVNNSTYNDQILQNKTDLNICTNLIKTTDEGIKQNHPLLEQPTIVTETSADILNKIYCNNQKSDSESKVHNCDETLKQIKAIASTPIDKIQNEEPSTFQNTVVNHQLLPKDICFIMNLTEDSSNVCKESNILSNKISQIDNTVLEEQVILDKYDLDYEPNQSIPYKEHNKAHGNNENFKKYTMTAERIDMQTNFIANRQIQIVRKLKVDLDITETLLMDKSKYPGNNESNTSCDVNVVKLKPSFNELSESVKKHDKSIKEKIGVDHNKVNLKHITNVRKKNISPIAILTTNYKSSINKNDSTQIPTLIPNETTRSVQRNKVSKVSKTPTSSSVLKEENISVPKNNCTLVPTLKLTPDKISSAQRNNIPQIPTSSFVYKEATSVHKDNSMSNKITSEYKNTTPELTTLNFELLESTSSYETNNTRIPKLSAKEKKIDENPKPQGKRESQEEENSIENILHRYRDSLRLNRNNNDLPANPIQKIFKDNDYKRKIKSKKPFKITEISNLSIPLDEFYNLHKPTNANENPVTSINLNDNKISDIIDSCTVTDNNEIPSLNDIIACHANKDLEECNTISPIEMRDYEHHTSEFDIDNSMLDPKTLLKCYNSDANDEIIPPPPEFSDINCKYSPDFDNSLSCKDNINCYSFTESHCFDNSDDINYNDFFNEEMCFENDNLSPFKDIETWTVSQNDDSANNLLHPTATLYVKDRFQSHTSTLMNNRRGKLSYFKFNRSKNKMRK